ncbi:MAG: ribonuclease Y [Candidatus Aerophobetes bacterium]|nr:ribonuclease Y [Candidatus Aerophobetes bacterium]
MILRLIYILLAALTGWAVTTFIDRYRAKSILNKAKNRLLQIEEEIQNKRREIELEKREELQRLRNALEQRIEKKREELHRLSKRLIEREENLDHRLQEVEKEGKKISFKDRKLEEKEKEIEALEIKRREELEKIAGISAGEAKKSLLEDVRKEAEEEAFEIVQKVEKRAQETANKRARKIVATAIQRCAVDQTMDSVISTVTLPNDDMKGRVIGREGRNIRAFEALTGVDLIVDDTPETVIISCFDPLRRKIAEISLQRLIADSRIHPARIEEIVEKAKKDVEEIIREEGQQIVFDAGISDLPSELTNLLGKLKFRTSYGQNVLKHSQEVSYIAGIMAAEIGASYIQAKRAGLLHDIGKAVDQQMEGPHALVGARIAKQYGESPEVVHAIAAHHDNKLDETTLGALIQTADAISAARPGARKEVLEAYLKRLEDLENIAISFQGVDKAYAIQAGREIRIMVQPQKIDDEKARRLCQKIAKRTEKDLCYPGQIKVTVIRELRYIEYAK